MVYGGRVGIAASWLAVAVAMTACGDLGEDFASGAGAEDGDTDGPGNADTDNPTPVDGDDDTATTDDPESTGAESGGSDDGGTDGEDDGSGAVCDLECGESGWCDYDDNGAPTCACDEGFASTGLGCVPCNPVEDGVLPGLVPSIEATFTISVNEDTPDASPYDFGRIELRNRATGDRVELGRTADETLTARIVPGTYDVLYSVVEAGATVPKNRGAVLSTVELTEDGTELKIDVPTASIAGRITVGGSTSASNVYNFGRLWLVNKYTGDRVLLGTTRDPQYSARVIPGDYEVRYEVRENDGDVPSNFDGFVSNLSVGQDDDALDIDVPLVRYSGDVTIDEQSVGSPYEGGRLELRDVDTGDVFSIGDTRDEEFDIAVLPGSYEILYTHLEGGDAAPVNKGAILGTIDLPEPDNGTGAVTSDIKIKTVVVSGGFQLGDSTPPGNTADDGVISLESPMWGTAVLGNTHDGAYVSRVIQGEYDAYYAQETASVVMPKNTHAKLSEKPFTLMSEAMTIEIPVVEVTGNLTIGGVEAPDSPYDDGRLYLRNRDTGDSVLLGNTRLGTYAARIVPGTYDVVYENEFSDTQLPINRGAVVRTDVTVDVENDQLDIDVPVSTVVGDIEIGNSTPELAEGLGQLFLVDRASGDEIFIGHTGAASFARPLTDGTYLMEYRGVAAEGATLGDSLPANERAVFACFNLSAE
ncbi:MAG: hypothetical protein AAGA54_06110 [Myxococcota bacterium]